MDVGAENWMAMLAAVTNNQNSTPQNLMDIEDKINYLEKKKLKILDREKKIAVM